MNNVKLPLDIQQALDSKIIEIYGKIGLCGLIAICGIVFLFYKFVVPHFVDKKIELYKSQIREEELKNQDRWKIKRDACLEALKIADAAISNMTWSNLSKEANSNIRKQEVDTIKARECYGKLACTCESPDVLEKFKKTLGAIGPITPDVIVDLRNAVRKELGFKKDIDTDREHAFIARIPGDNK